MGELLQLNKHEPLMTVASLERIRQAIRDDNKVYLQKLYLRTIDPLQLVLLEGIFHLQNWDLPQLFEEPPKEFA